MANIYDMSDTWNDGATTFTAIKIDVTDTASASGSLLMDLQVGGSSKFSVRKDGYITTSAPIQVGTFGIISVNNAVKIGFGTTQNSYYNLGSSSLNIGSALSIAWSSTLNASTGTKDLFIFRDAANTLAQRNSTNAQTFNLYNTYTDASNYERARFQWLGNELRVGTEASGTGAFRSIGLYIGNSRYQIMGSNFNQFDQPIYMNTTGIATGSGANGFKIGTATTQGLGFWNATPSAQPAAVADATDAASVITQLNELLARLRTIGLIAT